ncbi:MAG TPA: F0F1 ATP synthase subunit B [Thermoguttaceae bacterium]|nr:F0F1 ATP synthase subunit B [Thermoguttaceae bacterium]
MTRVRVIAGLLVGLAIVVWCFGTARAESEQPDGEHHGTAVAEEAGHGSHGGGEVDTNPLEFKKDLALWTGVVFLILLAVLWKFAWGPIREGLERRESGIANQIAEAEQANQRAKELLDQYEKKLTASKDEVREILEKGRRDAEKTGRDIVEQARAGAEAEQRRAIQQIDAATSAALKELAEKGADLAVSLAGKIVRAELKPSDHAKLIRQTVADFAQQSPSEN